MADAGGFRIARGYVDIVGRVDEARTRAAAGEAGRDAGEDFERSFTRHWERQRRDSRGRFMRGFERDGDESGERTGRKWATRFGDIVTKILGKTGNAAFGLFGKSISGLPPQVQAAIGASIIGAVAAVAPILGGTIAGAVVGLGGVGGVVGGLILAAQHPAVKAAAKAAGGEIKSEFQAAAAAFVPATIHALDIIRSDIRDMRPELEGVFSGMSKFVEPFAQGVTGMLRELLPGFQAIADHGMPVIRELADWLPRIGRVLAMMFSEFSDHAFEASRALQAFWIILEYGALRPITATIAGLTEMYGWFEKLSFIARGDIAGLMEYVAAEQAAKEKGDELPPTLQEIIDGFTKQDEKTRVATQATRDWLEVMREATGQNLDARGSLREMEAAIDDASAALKENGRTIDENTPKGRANQAALDRLAAATNRVYDATYKQTHSQDAANAAAARGRQRFIALAEKMGYTHDQAVILADQLIQIPNVKRDITVDKAQAAAAIKAVKQGIATIHNKTVTITVKWETHGKVVGEHIIGQGTQLKAEGGWVHGIGGPTDDKNPALLSNKEFVLRAKAAERLTQMFGPEFLPSLNNYDRGIGSWSKHPVVAGQRKQWARTEQPPTAAASLPWGGDGAAAAPAPAPVHIANLNLHVDSEDLADMQKILALFESLPTKVRQYGAAPSAKVR